MLLEGYHLRNRITSYPLPIGGGVLLNDTKFLCGKTINSALRPIQMLILLILR